jgi:hypothetical protein
MASRSAGKREPTTKPARHIAVRIVWAIFGVFASLAVIVTDWGPRIIPGSPAALVRDFAQLQTSVKGPIGIALAPVGGPGTPLSLGDWHSGAAWSTMKVPLVIAALREEDPPHVTAEMTAAITQSDNAAAEAIWAGLGDPATAAAKVQAVLAEAGDSTAVQSRRVRTQYSAFGQTDWSLSEQVRFLSVAACDSRNAPVLTLMGHVAKDQRWGLGNIAGTRFKGGWGPSVSGAYLERQIGLIATPTGVSAVAVAAETTSGSYTDAVRDLNVIARWLLDHLAMLPSGHCRH